MRVMSGWAALFLCVSVTAACGGDPRPTPTDGGPTADAGDGGRLPDGGDGGMRRDGGGDAGACAGRALCDVAGSTCDTDTLVVCAADADGCLVETRTGCGATGEVCNAPAGGDAACVDPCSLLAPETVCLTDGERTCSGYVLSTCAPNADGCLVLTVEDCAASPGGVCDTTGAMPVCALPADPCAAIPAAERCASAGTSCDVGSLVTCAPNAFGCLVTTTTDCTARTGGACDASGAAATCTATDACAGVMQCAAAGTSCDGPSLVVCAPDAFGCLIETRTVCTDAAFGFCDAAATPAPTCATAATDPCLGVTTCGSAPARACTDRGTLTVCVPNAFGCYVSTDTSCAAGSEVCDATGGTATCVDPCSLITTCASATSCASNTLVTCTADADGCLVESARAPCAYICDAASSPAACVDPYCPEAQPTVLDCASGTVTGTTLGGTTAIATNCDGNSNYDGAERIYRFRNSGADRVAVQIVATRGAASGDFDLFVWDGGDGTNVCTTTAGTDICLDSSTGVSATETVNFFGEPGQTEYVAYDIYSGAATTSDYSFAVTCIPLVCGDGILAPGETCDDGNTAASDGCSTTCTVEAGFGCTGTTPSVCTPLCGNGVVNVGETCDDGGITSGNGCSATCAIEAGYGCSGAPSVCVTLPANVVCGGATAVSATTSITGENIAYGGTRPTGTGCGGGSGTKGLFYSMTIPALTAVTIEVTPTFDAVLIAKDSCAATTCGFMRDDPELGTIVNNTASPITQIVAVSAYGSSTTSGTYDISFTYVPFVCGNGVLEGTEVCDDGGILPGDGCSATCTLEPGYICSGAPSVCATSATNGTCATAAVITGTDAYTGEATIGGGAKPTGTGCGFGTGVNTLYYSVTVPPMTNVNVVTTPAAGSDIVLAVEDACGAAACLLYSDSAPERTTLSNATATAFTRIVAIRPYASTTQALFDVAFTYVPFVCGNGLFEGAESCDDGNLVAGDGCSATCTVETNYVCTNTTPSVPSVCRLASPAGFCATGTVVTGTSTLTAQASAAGGPRPSGTGCGTNASNNAIYYSVQIPPSTRVVAQTTPAAGSDIVLLTEDACGDAACTYRTDSAPEQGTLINSTASTVTRIVAVHPWSATGVATWSIAFTYVTFVCGNGVLEGPETCDDGNAVAGDGCTACAQDAGFACIGAPSVCALASANAFCASAELITGSTLYTGESTAGGGVRPTGTGCGFGAGARALWYSVTVPPGKVVMVQTTPLASSDLVLFTQNTCAETACVSYTDSAPEGVTLTNATATAFTRLVGVRSYGTGVSTFNISFTYVNVPTPATPITAACIDISTSPANTYTVAGATDDATTAITALPIPFTFFGTTITHWSMNSNGLLQLWTSATGTPSTAFSNAAIPSTSTPNNFIAPLWDDMSIGALLGGGTGSTRTATVGSGPSRIQVFEWSASHFAADNLRFQVQLNETSNVIEIHYCSTGTGSSAATGSSATIGIENASGGLGVQTSYNTGASAVTGTGYRYTP